MLPANHFAFVQHLKSTPVKSALKYDGLSIRKVNTTYVID